MRTLVRIGARALVVLAVLRLAAAAPVAAAAPPDDAAATQQRIDKLEKELQELKKDTRKLEVTNEEAAKLKPIAGWDKGFFIQSPDGANKLNVGGYVHFDGYFTTRGGDPSVSQFTFRRVRLDLKGKLFKYYEFRLLTDFAGGQAIIQDAYVNVNYVPWAQPQAGKYKTPFGIERLQSANALVFVRRALPNNLVPNRDLGFMLWGTPFYGALTYQLAILDGVVDGGANNADTDFNDDKTFAGRLFVEPFKDTPIEPLRGFGVGFAGTYGRMSGSPSNTQLPSYRIDGQQVFFNYVVSNPSTAAGTAIAHGPQWRISPQGYWYWGPFGFLWEWVESNNDVQLGTTRDRITATAWQTQLSWVLTGENNSYRGITAARQFDPWRFLDGYWGAVMLAARYAELSVEKDVYTLGFANPAKAARQASSWGFGVDWTLNPMLRLMLDFERNQFTGGAANGNRPTEDVIISRVQFVF